MQGSKQATAAAPAADSAWREAFVRGERDVLEQLYRATFDVVRTATGRVLRDPADRDNVVQAVYTELISSQRMRANYRGGQIGAWLAAIARHRAIDFARRESRRSALPDADDRPAPTHPLAEFRAELEHFGRTLGDGDRALLRLRFIEGMTQIEAAQALDLPRSTLEDREHTLKKRLRAHLLAGDGEGEGAADAEGGRGGNGGANAGGQGGRR